MIPLHFIIMDTFNSNVTVNIFLKKKSSGRYIIEFPDSFDYYYGDDGEFYVDANFKIQKNNLIKIDGIKCSTKSVVDIFDDDSLIQKGHYDYIIKAEKMEEKIFSNKNVINVPLIRKEMKEIMFIKTTGFWWKKKTTEHLGYLINTWSRAHTIKRTKNRVIKTISEPYEIIH